MITELNPDLLILSAEEKEWLQLVGTQFAVAYYEQNCHEVLAQQHKNTVLACAARSLIDAQEEAINVPCPFDSGKEVVVDLFELETAIDCWEGQERDRLEQELQVLEHKLIAVGDVEESNWIEPDPDHAATATLEHHPHLKPFWKSRMEILHGWQKAEAGY